MSKHISRAADRALALPPAGPSQAGPSPAGSSPAGAAPADRPTAPDAQGLTTTMVWLIGFYIVASMVICIVHVIVMWPAPQPDGTGWRNDAAPFFIQVTQISPHGRLISLVLLAGALGGTVDAIGRYIQQARDGSFGRGDGWFYLLRPFQGAIVAVVFFFVVSEHSGVERDPSKAYAALSRDTAIAALVGLINQRAVDLLDALAERLLDSMGAPSKNAAAGASSPAQTSDTAPGASNAAGDTAAPSKRSGTAPSDRQQTDQGGRPS